MQLQGVLQNSISPGQTSGVNQKNRGFVEAFFGEIFNKVVLNVQETGVFEEPLDAEEQTLAQNQSFFLNPNRLQPNQEITYSEAIPADLTTEPMGNKAKDVPNDMVEDLAEDFTNYINRNPSSNTTNTVGESNNDTFDDTIAKENSLELDNKRSHAIGISDNTQNVQMGDSQLHTIEVPKDELQVKSGIINLGGSPLDTFKKASGNQAGDKNDIKQATIKNIVDEGLEVSVKISKGEESNKNFLPEAKVVTATENISLLIETDKGSSGNTSLTKDIIPIDLAITLDSDSKTESRLEHKVIKKDNIKIPVAENTISMGEDLIKPQSSGEELLSDDKIVSVATLDDKIAGEKGYLKSNLDFGFDTKAESEVLILQQDKIIEKDQTQSSPEKKELIGTSSAENKIPLGKEITSSHSSDEKNLQDKIVVVVNTDNKISGEKDANLKKSTDFNTDAKAESKAVSKALKSEVDSSKLNSLLQKNPVLIKDQTSSNPDKQKKAMDSIVKSFAGENLTPVEKEHTNTQLGTEKFSPEKSAPVALTDKTISEDKHDNSNNNSALNSGSSQNSTFETVPTEKNVRPTPLQNLLNNQIVKNFALVQHRGINEVKVDLKPDFLGQVSIRLVMENGRMVGRIVVEREEVKNVLEKQLTELKTTLTQMNIKIDDLSVDYDKNLKNQEFKDSLFNQNNNQQRQNRYEEHSLRKELLKEEVFDTESLELPTVNETGINLFA